MIKIKRIYEPASDQDGIRILIDRLWPRGVTKEEAKLDMWMKNIAPSNELRKWFNHDPEKFEDFCMKYIIELTESPFKKDLHTIQEMSLNGMVTLVYSAKDKERNQAIVLKEYLET